MKCLDVGFIDLDAQFPNDLGSKFACILIFLHWQAFNYYILFTGILVKFFKVASQ